MPWVEQLAAALQGFWAARATCLLNSLLSALVNALPYPCTHHWLPGDLSATRKFSSTVVARWPPDNSVVLNQCLSPATAHITAIHKEDKVNIL